MTARPLEVVVLNANTTTSITRAQQEFCARVAQPGTSITAIQPDWGPAAVRGWADAYRSAAAMLDRMAAFDGPMDALVLAAYGDLGVEGLGEILSVPVIDIVEASAREASEAGRRFGVVTTGASMIPLIEQRLRLTGHLDACVDIVAMDERIEVLRADAGVLSARFDAAVERVRARGAEAVCLGAGALSDRWPDLAARCPVPLIEPLAAAVRWAETLAAAPRAVAHAP